MDKDGGSGNSYPCAMIYAVCWQQGCAVEITPVTQPDRSPPEPLAKQTVFNMNRTMMVASGKPAKDTQTGYCRGGASRQFAQFRHDCSVLMEVLPAPEAKM